MTQGRRSHKQQSNDSSFMVHILSLGGLIATLLITQSQPILNHPMLIIIASAIYLLVNTYVDYRNKHLSTASFTEYFAIMILTVVIVLSFR